MPSDTAPDLAALVLDCLVKNPDARPTAALIAALLEPHNAAAPAQAVGLDETAFMGPLPRRAALDD